MSEQLKNPEVVLNMVQPACCPEYGPVLNMDCPLYGPEKRVLSMDLRL